MMLKRLNLATFKFKKTAIVAQSPFCVRNTAESTTKLFLSFLKAIMNCHAVTSKYWTRIIYRCEFLNLQLFHLIFKIP